MLRKTLERESPVFKEYAKSVLAMQQADSDARKLVQAAQSKHRAASDALSAELVQTGDGVSIVQRAKEFDKFATQIWNEREQVVPLKDVQKMVELIRRAFSTPIGGKMRRVQGTGITIGQYGLYVGGEQASRMLVSQLVMLAQNLDALAKVCEEAKLDMWADQCMRLKALLTPEMLAYMVSTDSVFVPLARTVLDNTSVMRIDTLRLRANGASQIVSAEMKRTVAVNTRNNEGLLVFAQLSVDMPIVVQRAKKNVEELRRLVASDERSMPARVKDIFKNQLMMEAL
jgi:hypothetical protein